MKLTLHLLEDWNGQTAGTQVQVSIVTAINLIFRGTARHLTAEEKA